MKTRTSALGLILAGLAFGAVPAQAHESPTGCTATALKMQVNGLNTIKRNGDVVPVTAGVGNNNPGTPCDVTNATVTLHLPAPDGSPNGQNVVLATGVDFPSGAAITAYPAVNYTVNFNDGVFRGPVSVQVEGTAHYPGGSDPADNESLGTIAAISRPHATLTVTPNPTSGDAPLDVTYTYSVLNDSPHDPNVGAVDPGMFPVNVADDSCSPVTFTGGDANSNTVLDRTETWTFTCSRSFFGGMFTNHASVTSTSTRDGRPWPATTAQSTVAANGPDMTLAKTHAGTFTRGDDARTYTLTATNGGNRVANGAATVADTLPAGLIATGISGSGWGCDLATLSCTRSDALAAGASYPPITLTVDVPGSAPSSVVNTATVSRAGQNTANDGASDPTAIASVIASGVGGIDITPPRFLKASMSPRRFKKKGTTFAYTLSETARVTFAIERKERGRKVGKQCRKPSRKNRAKKACVRYVKVGSFAQSATAGRNTKKWSGKLGKRALKPGSYRASLTAKDGAGNRSQAKRLSFRIVGR